jgi:putative ATPase
VCARSVPEWTINSHLDSNCSALSGPTSSSSSSQELKIVHESPREPPSTSKKKTVFSQSLKRKSPETSPEPVPGPSNPPPAGPSNPKRFKSTAALEAAKPLAERVRPRTLDQIVGQEHLLSKNGLLRSMIEKDQVGSMVLWGPPGTGKTTLARVIGTGRRYSRVERLEEALIVPFPFSQHDEECLSRAQCDQRQSRRCPKGV